MAVDALAVGHPNDGDIRESGPLTFGAFKSDVCRTHDAGGVMCALEMPKNAGHKFNILQQEIFKRPNARRGRYYPGTVGRVRKCMPLGKPIGSQTFKGFRWHDTHAEVIDVQIY